MRLEPALSCPQNAHRCGDPPDDCTQVFPSNPFMFKHDA